MDADRLRSISETDKPNAGRIYDYFIGGTHNFDIDRKAAKEVIKITPWMPNLLKLIRWFLSEAVRRLLDQGYTKFLDFASGLPTMDHIHQITPAGTQVIYSDHDPLVVEYGKKIIGNNPDIKYTLCDAGNPEILLNSGIAEQTFGDDQKIAIGFNGVAWFLPEEQLHHSMKILYDWAEEGTKLFICDGDTPDTPERARELQLFYESVGDPIYYKSIERLIKIVHPWQIEDPGLMKLEKWMEMNPTTSDEIEEDWGGVGAIYGGILSK